MGQNGVRLMLKGSASLSAGGNGEARHLSLPGFLSPWKPGPRFPRLFLIQCLVQEDTISEARIVQSYQRIRRLKSRL
jgi:hypothetical protein